MSAKKYYNVKAGPDRPDSVVAKNADVLERAAEVKRLRAGGVTVKNLSVRFGVGERAIRAALKAAE